MILEIAYFSSELDETASEFMGYTRFVLYDGRFNFRGRIVELDGHEPLLRAGLQIFEHALITRIVGDHQQKVIGGFDDLPFFFDRQGATGVREWVGNDGGCRW